MMTDLSVNKILVIGLDGATLDLVEPWALEGKLPIIAKLMERGSYTRLRSVMPVLSSAAWPSFMTGMNPGKHGMYDFVQRDLKNFRLRIVNRENIQATSLWKLLSLQGRKVGVINVPMTYPPEELNGFIVTGLGTPEFKTFTYPPELSKNLRERGYIVNKQIYFKPGKEDDYLEEIYRVTEAQFENALWLMRNQEWDLFMTVFFDTDQIAHFYWHYMDPTHPRHKGDFPKHLKNAILSYYQKLDEYIGELVDAAGPETNVIILSDHGTGPLHKDVYLNEWLRQQGFLILDDQTAKYRGMRNILARLGITRRNISQWLKKYQLGWLENWLTEILGDNVLLIPRTQHAEFPIGIDWERTRAYSFGYQGQIYINLIGREPSGIVNQGEEYEELMEEISCRLLELIDPDDGKPVVDRIYRRDDLFRGPNAGLSPDLTLIMRGLKYITRYGYENSPYPGFIFTDPSTHESGSHRQEGVLIACGPNVENKGSLPESANLIDLAPSILYLMDCFAPTDMDGKVLDNIFSTGKGLKISEHQVEGVFSQTASKQLSLDDEKEIINRLRNMGYLE